MKTQYKSSIGKNKKIRKEKLRKKKKKKILMVFP